jgi:hypothetical protein
VRKMMMMIIIIINLPTVTCIPMLNYEKEL